jgi:acyl carrier protein
MKLEVKNDRYFTKQLKTLMRKPMQKKEIEKIVLNIIKESLELKHTPALTETMKDLGADSLDVIEMSMEAENVFLIDIPDYKYNEILTVGGFIEYIETEINSGKTE